VPATLKLSSPREPSRNGREPAVRELDLAVLEHFELELHAHVLRDDSSPPPRYT